MRRGESDLKEEGHVSLAGVGRLVQDARQMITVDFHSHSLFSKCGLHTILEMLTYAKRAGLKGLAITDHGPEIQGHIASPFFERLQNPVPGIRLIKGMECNLKGLDGEIDLPQDMAKFLDILLLGIHYNTQIGLGRERYTEVLLKALDRNPWVDLITHTNDSTFLVDFDRIAERAAKLGMAMELNNSKCLYSRIDEGTTLAMIEACKRAGCRMALCSDAHAVHEIGLDNSVRPLLKKARFPGKLIVNRTAASAFAFLKERKTNRERLLGNREA